MTLFIEPRSKLYAHLDRLQAIKDYARNPVGNRPAPVNIEVDISFRCDYKCLGCHFAYTHTRGPWAGKVDKPHDFIAGGDLMTLDMATGMLDQFAAYQGHGDTRIKSVTWTGGGEATIHPQFDAIIAHAASVGLEQGIYTHGAHITQERAIFMKRHFSWVYFSTDACTRESYKKHKGVDRFDKVCENIRRIVAMEGDATIGMGFLLHADNVDDIHEMVRLGRSLGVDYVQFRPLIVFEQATPQELIAETQWVNRAIGMLNAYKGDDFVIGDASRFERYAKWGARGYDVCHWSALQVVVTPNGRVWRCTNKREYPDGLLGDLATEDFATIWNRSGGSCAVNGKCRISCKGDLGNQSLAQIYAERKHSNFI